MSYYEILDGIDDKLVDAIDFFWKERARQAAERKRKAEERRRKERLRLGLPVEDLPQQQEMWPGALPLEQLETEDSQAIQAEAADKRGEVTGGAHMSRLERLIAESVLNLNVSSP